ncbi:MAG: hypothetical protein IK079_02185 [Desulfovibrio sp.]|nr:hypothetical protein [Desulfovibrio sp.]
MSYAVDGDTLVINNPKSVTIISNDSVMDIKVNGREGDENYIFHDKVHVVGSSIMRETIEGRDWDNNIPKVAIGDHDSKLEATAHFGIGFTSPTSVSSGMDFSTGSSWEIFFTPLVFDLYTNSKKGDLISLGLGFDWRNYRMTNNVRFLKNDDGKVVLGSYPEGASPKFSRVKVFSLNFPLLYQHKFGRSWGFGIGPVFNLNTYASLKTSYKQDGGTHKFVDKHIGQRKFTIDAMFILENPIFDLYLKYCPMDVLKDSDLKFKSLSFGIYL